MDCVIGKRAVETVELRCEGGESGAVLAKKLLILTGDHSADAHAANVVRALRANKDQGWTIAAIGGGHLRDAGIDELIADHRDMNVIGLGGVIRAVPSHLRLARRILDWVDRHKPDVAILIDYGVFHLWLAPKLKARGVKVLYFIPPQIWASRPGRIKKLQRGADRVLVILPFEENWYRQRGVEATFVGNPLASALPPAQEKESFCRRHGLDGRRTLIGLFPGSRKLEINQLLRAQIEAARLLDRRHPGQFVFAMSRARNLKEPFFQSAFERAGGDTAPLKVVEENHSLLSAADLVLLASGTVTLEATLYATPMIVMYRGPWHAYQLARRMIRTAHVSLPNNLAGRQIVPELLQYDLTPQRIADEAERLLEPQRRERMREELRAIAGQFADAQAPQRVVDAILDLSRASGH